MNSAHHTLYSRCTWEAHFATRKIRQNHGLIVPMNEEIEDILHKEIPIIPVLDHYTAMATIKEYKPTDSYIKNVRNLMSTIEEIVERPKFTEIQRCLGELTVYALEKQIPYLQDGQLTDYVGDIR